MAIEAAPIDSNHAFLVGALVGMVVKAREDGFTYRVELMDDEDGIHLDTFKVIAPSGTYLVSVKRALS